MTVKHNMRTAAEVLVDQLIINGVRHAFCVPGESYLAVLDAFHDRDVAVTVCRQEGGAAMMAEAVGKATGRPGVCFVTRGPGATNASPGIHIAQQDSTPMILFVGQVARSMRGREAFQELDYRAVFGTMAKWATEIDDPTRVPEIVSHAFHVAANGRPGPVVVALPEDMLTERVAIGDGLPYFAVEAAPGRTDIEAFTGLVAAAERPMFLVGGSRWSETGCAAMMRFAERFAVPVATTFRRAHLFDALHPNYAGDLGIGPNPKLLARVKEADLLVLVGGRLSEMQTQGYTLLDIPAPQMTFVHVHPDAGELGRVYRPRLGINATPAAFAIAVAELDPPAAPRWAGAAKTARETAHETAHADYLAWTGTPTEVPGGVNLGGIMVWLRDHLPADAMISNGAGNYSVWVHRYYRHRRFATQFSPIAGSMGYGVPAAIAVKRLYPDRVVVAVSGDGDFLMNGQDFATAVQYEAPVIVIVADNGQYGTIRMHQERHYPGRISATQLRNPDFAAYARAFGGFGVTVENTADFPAAFTAAQQSRLPAIIHLKVDPEAITPTTTLAKIREAALAQRAGK
jgi:acetolactate synthase-1/2/3 large subunit